MNGCPEIKKRRSLTTKKSWDLSLRGQIPKVVRKKRNNFLTIEEQESIIKDFRNGASINFIKEKTGRGYAILTRLLKQSGVCYDKEKIRANKERMERDTPNVFVKNSNATNSSVRRIVVTHDLLPHTECWECGLSEWLKGELVLELDHIDGDNKNNEIFNLRFLCPNCHSQTKTYRGRRINTGKTKVTDEQIIESLKEQNGSVRKALISLGLNVRPYNYIRANTIKKMMSKNSTTQQTTNP
jgi:Zn finger protein HypA/HybF involved in hydrogenase expression